MKTRRRITGVLCSLLDSFGSRYSDFDGYWIFGLLLRESETFSIPLISTDYIGSDLPVLKKAKAISRHILREQMQKAHIPIECISDAILRIRKLEDGRSGLVNGRVTEGFLVSVSADAISDYGKNYRAEKFLFVAPHNSALEARSTRREKGPNKPVETTPSAARSPRLT